MSDWGKTDECREHLKRVHLCVCREVCTCVCVYVCVCVCVCVCVRGWSYLGLSSLCPWSHPSSSAPGHLEPLLPPPSPWSFPSLVGDSCKAITQIAFHVPIGERIDTEVISIASVYVWGWQTKTTVAAFSNPGLHQQKGGLSFLT